MKIEGKVLKILQDLGFDITCAEGNQEYHNKKGLYRRTPDFIQANFIGGGSPLDFFIDLNTPNISYFQKRTILGKKIMNSFTNKTNINFSNNEISRVEIEEVLKHYNKKIEKYSTTRNNSPLFGWVTYFDSSKYDLNQNLFISIFYLTLVDGAMGTALYKRKIIRDYQWAQEVNKCLHKYRISHDGKFIIESILHDKCAFFMIITDNPPNKKILLFINKKIINNPDLRIQKNTIIMNLKKLL